MQEWLLKLITNPYLITGVSSWAIAQVLKTIIHFIVNKQLKAERLFGDGGMPSGHSATVSSLATIICLMQGPDSVAFAISAILAIIVCHDATGVRMETGKQNMVLNELINLMESDELPEVKLKEFVGHTPIQVAVGILIGIANALVMYFCVFN